MWLESSSSASSSCWPRLLVLLVSFWIGLGGVALSAGVWYEDDGGGGGGGGVTRAELAFICGVAVSHFWFILGASWSRGVRTSAGVDWDRVISWFGRHLLETASSVVMIFLLRIFFFFFFFRKAALENVYSDPCCCAMTSAILVSLFDDLVWFQFVRLCRRPSSRCFATVAIEIKASFEGSLCKEKPMQLFAVATRLNQGCQQ